jgi:hypothetical protein
MGGDLAGAAGGVWAGIEQGSGRHLASAQCPPQDEQSVVWAGPYICLATIVIEMGGLLVDFWWTFSVSII